MTRTFNYKEKFSWEQLGIFGVSVVIIVYGFFERFNIRYKGIALFEYPTSKYVLIALGIIGIFFTINKFLRIIITNSSDNIIIMTDQDMKFKDLTIYSLNNVKLLFINIRELWNKTTKDDGDSIVISTNNDRKKYEFFANKFNSIAEFIEFKMLLEEKCINIINIL